MSCSLLSVALFCFAAWISLSDATQGPVVNCCEQWSKTKIPLTQVKNYTSQSEGSCPIKATIILTKKGKRLCSNPDDGWTKKAMRKVDEETKTLLQRTPSEEEGSAGVITPAVVQVSKKKSRRGRRPQGKGSRGGKKGKRKSV